MSINLNYVCASATVSTCRLNLSVSLSVLVSVCSSSGLSLVFSCARDGLRPPSLLALLVSCSLVEIFASSSILFLFNSYTHTLVHILRVKGSILIPTSYTHSHTASLHEGEGETRKHSFDL